MAPVDPRDAVFWPRLFRTFRIAPTFPQLGLGSRQHVASLHLRVRDGPACQVFYPTEPSPNHQEPVRGNYMREAAVVGLANYAKVSPTILSGLVDTPHHVVAAASAALHPDLAEPLATQGVPSLPVILFSHGLAGSSEVYSVLCKDLASTGRVVVAVEHEDQSGSYACTAEGEHLFYSYEPPPDFDVNDKEQVVAFRAPFLEKRVEEMKTVVSWLQTQVTAAHERRSGDSSVAADDSNQAGPIADGAVKEASKSLLPAVESCADVDDADADRVWQQIAPHLNMDALVLAGHSFGAATVYLTAQELPATRCTILLDTWSYPISSDALGKGVKAPVLSVLSEAFIDNDFSADTKQLLDASESHESYYIAGSIHQSFSDIPWFLPSWMARWAKLSGATDREAVREANHNLSAAFLAKHVPVADDELLASPAANADADDDSPWQTFVKPF
jgi:platelet-activating factor acetylhydrolase